MVVITSVAPTGGNGGGGGVGCSDGGGLEMKTEVVAVVMLAHHGLRESPSQPLNSSFFI